MSLEEYEAVDILIRLFKWADTPWSQFEALRMLRGARKESAPTWDDFRAGIHR